ncbi:Invasion associated protein p60 [hydrothermal vent metagenome]|uniref:Invasion associated protein p60 n=1 Tax=hydrothermal vent metagenome TaxID=652676 RepID=A0A1W1BJP8_9ZZZZ
MQKIFLILLSLLNSYLYADKSIDCNIHIDISKNSTQKVVLQLSYDKECSIVMDQNSSKITIMPKADNNISTDINKTEKLISLAKSKLGASYEPAKSGPDHFDCSGFVYYLFKENGIKIPRTSLSQSKSGDKLTREELKRGDIVFFDTYDRKHVNHSGVYLGDGKFIHSSSGKAYGVTISDIDKGFYKDKFRWGVRKIFK